MEHHTRHTAIVTPLLWLALLVLLVAYLAAAVHQRQTRRGWSGWRAASFAAGVGLLALAASPSLATLGSYDLRGHMLQHLLGGMLAPLGLALARPLTLALRTLPISAARRLVRLLHLQPLRWLSHPVSALLLNSGGLYLLYLTPLYALSRGSLPVHLAVNVHIVLAGLLFTWAIIEPEPRPHRVSWPVRLSALFVAIAAHATLAKLMYAYGWPAGAGHSAEQVRAAAQLMYYGGDAVELLLAICLFMRRPAAPRRPQRLSPHPSGCTSQR